MADPRAPQGAKRRVLLVQPRFAPIGGAEVVAAWTLAALKDLHEVTVLSWTPVDVEGLNHFFGTSLRRDEFRQAGPPRWLRLAANTLAFLDGDPYSVQRYAALMRAARRLRADDDVVITTFHEADLGGPAIQYVHQPWCHREWARVRAGPPLRRALARARFALRPWRLLAGFSFERMRANLTLVNSDWMGARVREAYDIPTVTVHPPAPGRFPATPWKDRDPGVVCVGRLAAPKELERAIEIVGRLRGLGAPLRLHVAGRSQPEARSYLARLRRRAARLGDWVELHVDPDREALLALLGRQRFGLHTTRNEPFGIAVAEMARAGCVVLTPRSGGPPEITGGDEALVYDGIDDAVEKLGALLRSPERCEQIGERLRERARRFDVEVFAARMRELVAGFGSERTCG
jgi:glycosyltransferase involved in cell wall biosynthesis